MILMSDLSKGEQRLAKSHYYNTKQLEINLKSAIFKDISCNGYGDHPSNNTKINAAADETIDLFRCMYRIPSTKAYDFFQKNKYVYPRASLEVLIYSDLQPGEILLCTNDSSMEPLKLESRFISICHALSLSIDNTYTADFMSCILSCAQIRRISGLPDKLFFGPHIAISFGHFSLVLESIILLTRTFGSNNPTVYIFVDKEYPPDWLPILQFYQSCPLIASSIVITNDTNDFLRCYGYSNELARALAINNFVSFADCLAIPSININRSLPFVSSGSEKILRTHLLSSNVSNSSISPYVCIHTRDNTYSGNGQSYRDTDFSSYAESIDALGNLGSKTVRLSLAAALANNSNLVIDLSLINYINSLDQLVLIDKSQFVIGINSGISHYPCLMDKPTIYINCTALPCGYLNEKAVHAPQRIRIKRNSINRAEAILAIQELIVLLIKDWPDHAFLRYFSYEQMPSSLIKEEIIYFHNVVTQSLDIAQQYQCACTIFEQISCISHTHLIIPKYYLAHSSVHNIVSIIGFLQNTSRSLTDGELLVPDSLRQVRANM